MSQLPIIRYRASSEYRRHTQYRVDGWRRFFTVYTVRSYSTVSTNYYVKPNTAGSLTQYGNTAESRYGLR